MLRKTSPVSNLGKGYGEVGGLHNLVASLESEESITIDWMHSPYLCLSKVPWI